MSPENPKRKQSHKIGGIGKVETPDLPTDRPWVSVLKAFNPLGAAVDTYSKTLAYRLECKRLSIELRRVKEQAGILNSAIEKNHIQQMESLQQRRIALDRFYDTVQGQLAALHVERSMVLEIGKIAAERMLAPEVPLEEKKLFKEFASETMASLPAFGKNANESLATIVAALPPVEIPSIGLPEPE